MIKRTLAGMLAVSSAFILVLALSGPALAAEFSADVVTRAGGMTMTGKIYVKGSKIRNEMNMGPQSSASIVDMDSQTVITIIPMQRMYMEMTAQPDVTKMHQPLESLTGTGSSRLLGTETVNGYRCDKYIVTPQDRSQGSATYWISKKLGYPIKIVGQGPQGDFSTEYKNIREGGVSDSLFRPPPGYTKMEIPGMGPGMPQMPQGYPGMR